MVSLEAHGVILLIQFLMNDVLMTGTIGRNEKVTPMVINTWRFVNATQRAWHVLANEKKSALDAIEQGCSVCEEEQCDHTVGWGGSPDEMGETTLDAMIMDGPTHDVGAVAAMRRIKNAISVARKVLHHTEHTLLVGEKATQFAVKMGFKEESLTSNFSIQKWTDWKNNSCQPNFWKNVLPDPKNSCGPYKPASQIEASSSQRPNNIDENNHDTIGMIAIDIDGKIAAGTSTNGATYKIPGRVGDSSIVGSGAYVDQDIGGAAATGDGDVMMRFLPSYHAVESMRRGMNPEAAAEDAIKRIAYKYPDAQAAIVVTNIIGEFGAACLNIQNGFPYSVANPILGNVTVKVVDCLKKSEDDDDD